MLNSESWILKRASLTPFKIALIDIQTNRQWTYKELANETLKWLNVLQKRDYQREVVWHLLQKIVSTSSRYFLLADWAASSLFP